MSEDYDIVFSASTYKSFDCAIRFMESFKYMQGHNLLILTTPDVNEAKALMYKADASNVDIMIFHTDIDNFIMGRAYGFVWCITHDICGRYFCSCDDDLEWTDRSVDILDHLDMSYMITQFSMMAFDSTHPMHYRNHPYKQEINGIRIDIPWVDGNCIFTPYDFNEQFGLQDCLPEHPFSFFVETEYAHRFRFLSGKPVVVDIERQYYIHHFRNDRQRLSERLSKFKEGVSSGEEFWRRKFGLKVRFEGDIHRVLYGLETSPEYAKGFQQHLMFGGLWNDWDAIYAKYKDKYRQVYYLRSGE